MTTLDSNELQRKVFDVLRRCAEWKNHQIKFAIVCFAFVLFFTFPSIELLINRGQHDTWDTVQQQISNPLVQYNAEDPASHNAKRTFRLFVPVVASVLHIHNIWAIYSIQLLLTIVFFLLVIRLSEKITGDRITALLTALAFSFIYAGKVGCLDVFAKFDSIALLCLLAALYFENAMLVFLCCFAAAWTDERGLIACLIVFLWTRLSATGATALNLRNFIAIKWKDVAVVLAVAAYGLLRYYLSSKYHLTTPGDGTGISVLFSQVNMLFFGLWSGFEGLWLIIVLAIAGLLARRAYAAAIAVCLFSFPSILTSFFVLDITRSMIYCLPLFFICLKIMKESQPVSQLRTWMLISCLICFIVPTYFAEGAFRIEGSNPALFKLLDLLRS